MSAVRQKGTAPERLVRRFLLARGISFESNPAKLPGRPDIVNQKDRWAIFVNGCYWHAHPCRPRPPETNKSFWARKFRDNQKRDIRKIQLLANLGYSVLTLWECELTENILESRIGIFFSEHKARTFESHVIIGSEYVERVVVAGDGKKTVTRIPLAADIPGRDVHSAFDYSWLRLRERPASSGGLPFRVVDLFSGCGGLSLGAMEACTAAGRSFEAVAALDLDEDALKVYRANISETAARAVDIQTVVDGRLGATASKRERKFLDELGRVDLILAGPPCQGHSNLNNHTRRKDSRNRLYERVARLVQLTNPEHVLIENVATAIHGKEGSVKRTIRLLRKLKYNVSSEVVDLAWIGVPQRRKRHVVFASKSVSLTVGTIIRRFRVGAVRSVRWAIGDMPNRPSRAEFDCAAELSEKNRRRIRYLFSHSLYDLPNNRRPKCHQDHDHSYKSMYGRLKASEPAQTITSGFGSPGQGRYIHPDRHRTLTPHEAARIQFFPDFFRFDSVTSRLSLSQMIGNAVPMKLSYILVLAALVSKTAPIQANPKRVTASA